MNNKSILNIIFLFSASIVFTQESVNASGGNASGSGGTVSFSIGQVAYTSNVGTNGHVNQGVQQPYEIYSIGIYETESETVLSFYPNPASDILVLQFEDFTNHEASVSLVDETGRLLSESSITSLITSLNLSQYGSGVYLVHVKSASHIIESFKIIKN